MTSSFNWQIFLDNWSTEVIQLLRSQPQENLFEAEQAALARNSLAFPGATEAQIQALEARLQVTLPPSYIKFLQVSNGWLQIAMDAEDGKLWATEEVQWFRDQDPDWIAAWQDPDPALAVPDEVYFVYGEAQDCVHLRREYLKTALAISQSIESGVYLLNPQVVTADGEWEAWFFGDALPGADRYRSFQDLMQAEKPRILGNLREGLAYR